MTNLLIIGCGDIALRTLPLLQGHYQLYALVRNPAKADTLRKIGVTPLLGDLDERSGLTKIAGVADIVLHFAPPERQGRFDTRTRNLLSALSTRLLPNRLIYISTSGVYGDCGGDVVSETRPVNPQSERARLRVSAERQIRAWATRNHVTANILRVPGIIAEDRLPIDRIRAGTPAIVTSEDGYSNHIHADDLARIVIAALRYAKPNRVYHTVDDDEMKMGDYFDVVADAFKLPRPPRLSRAEAQRAVSPMIWSFMNESRRLTNLRMKKELNVALRYPSVASILKKPPQA
ncbi:MAG: SDR family oxidoreductase [Sideroxydans sp.]|jgi:nucleoside-diphosphate-sugar epimerase